MRPFRSAGHRRATLGVGDRALRLARGFCSRRPVAASVGDRIVVLARETSIRFLVLNGAPAAKVGEILHRISPSLEPQQSDIYILPESSGISKKPVRDLFAPEFIRPTILLSLAAFVAQLVIVYVVTWMPLVLASIGLPVTSAILASVAFSIGGVFGAIGLARIIDKDKSYRWLVVTFFLSAVSTAGIGLLAANWTGLLVITFVTGLLTVGANIVLSAYSATVYPTAIRSTGVRLGRRLGPCRRHRRRAVRHRVGRGWPEHRTGLRDCGRSGCDRRRGNCPRPRQASNRGRLRLAGDNNARLICG